MPVLPSFIPLYNKSKSKWPKFSKTPFSPRIGAPHTLPSTDTLDIQDTSSFGSVAPETTNSGAGTIPERPARPPPTPRIRLDFDLSEEPLDAWFQTQFLNENDAPLPLPLQNNARRKSTVGAVFVERTGVSADPELWQSDEVDVEGSAAEDDAVLDHIRALDQSTPFFGGESSSEERSTLPAGTASKRPPPSPILIPNLPTRNQLQLTRRSSDDPSSSNQSRPISTLSDSESSAVSGRTLARALLANSFVLSSSSDGRSSRYRSGIGGLVRTDSATLPRGEHPFLQSPYWRDRTLSGASDTMSSSPPEVPPIPANADKVYVPPQTLRQSGPELSTTRRKNLRRYSSTGSLKTPDSKRSSNDSKTRSRPNSTINSTSSTPDWSRVEVMEHGTGEVVGLTSGLPDVMDKDVRSVRRISRISEATTISTPTTPAQVEHAPDDLAPPVPEKDIQLARETAPPPSPRPLPSPRENPETREGHSQPSLLLPSATILQRSSVGSSSGRGTSPDPSLSPRELDTVLDYYSFIDTSPTSEPLEAPNRPFAPPFSPIPEETRSQLSSPPGTGRSVRSTLTMTPTILVGRSDLPPSDRRRSGQLSESSTITSSLGPATQALNGSPSLRANLSPVTRRTSRVVGGRNRTGSTPSPIKVDRDSKDMNAYKITVSPLPEGLFESPLTPSSGSTGSSAGVNRTKQTFPESPNMFSPMWTAASASSMTGTMQIQMQTHPEGVETPSLPETPASAGLSSIYEHRQQQILLTRAATTVQRRPARQGGLQRIATSRALPTPQTPPALSPTTAVAASMMTISGGKEQLNQGKPNALQTVDEIPSNYKRISALSAFSSPSNYSGQSPGLHSAFAGIPFQLDSPTATDDDDAGNDTHPYAHPALLEGSSQPSSLQPSPRLAHSPRENIIHPSTHSMSSRPATPLDSNHSSPVQHPMPLSEHNVSLQPHQSTDNPMFNSTSALSTNQNKVIRSPSPPPLPPVVITPPATDAGIPIPVTTFSNHYHVLSRISETSIATESPPPYETIDQDQSDPSSSGTNVDPQFTTLANSTPPMHTRNLSNDHNPLSRNGFDGGVRDKRHRPRPMAPTGPRRPSSSPHHPTATGTLKRDASISSVASEATTTHWTSVMAATANARDSAAASPLLPSGASSAALNLPKSDSYTISPASTTVASASPKTPQFKVPPLQYRGMTMEQAKWTFTSAQLQNIVSRAIRQSAEASSIRLLRLETLENEIPSELKQLEIRKADIIAKYRSLSCNSEALLSRLGQQPSIHPTSDIQTTIKLTREVKDVTRQLQALAEELHYVDQQQSQIEMLVERHHGSALSMALRKLNDSFTKQMSQTQMLQDRVSELEDENWTLRNELNALKVSQNNLEHQTQGYSQPQSPSQSQQGSEPSQFPSVTTAEPDRRKSTHSVVARRPSQRHSRSTRLSTNRSLSQRSSMSSNARSSVVGGISSTNSAFVVPPVPPVPPIPRRRPNDIFVNTTNRNTIFSQVISSDTGTANTELRTMLRLQDELYRTLGMSLGGPRLRRSNSVLGLTEPPPQQSSQPSATPSLYPSPSKSGVLNPFTLSPSASLATVARPLSYPTSLLDAYNHMDADRNAMLATLEMLSQDN